MTTVFNLFLIQWSHEYEANDIPSTEKWFSFLFNSVKHTLEPMQSEPWLDFDEQVHRTMQIKQGAGVPYRIHTTSSVVQQATDSETGFILINLKGFYRHF